MLFFRFESGELTDESRALVQSVLQAIKGSQGPDVTVLGHTDTTGTVTSNFELGLRRANAVRALLIEAGIDALLTGASLPIVARREVAQAGC